MIYRNLYLFLNKTLGPRPRCRGPTTRLGSMVDWRRCDGGGRQKTHVARVLEGRGELESEGRRGGGGQGWCSPFIRARGVPEIGNNGRLNGFNAIDGGEGLRGGLNWGFKAGEGKCLTRITRSETEATGMAGGYGKLWRCGRTEATQGKKRLTCGAHMLVAGKR
jgi:hypothetical protein